MAGPHIHGAHPIHIHPARPFYRYTAHLLGASMWFYVRPSSLTPAHLANTPYSTDNVPHQKGRSCTPRPKTSLGALEPLYYPPYDSPHISPATLPISPSLRCICSPSENDIPLFMNVQLSLTPVLEEKHLENVVELIEWYSWAEGNWQIPDHWEFGLVASKLIATSIIYVD